MTHRITFLAIATAVTVSVATQSIAASPPTMQIGVGDEATLNAHAMDLDARTRAAEKAGAISHADADRYSRRLEKMVRSAKADLRRPPHSISATKNIAYRQTLASVDAALRRVSR